CLEKEPRDLIIVKLEVLRPVDLQNHEDDVYKDYDYKDHIDVDQDKDIQESFDETYSLSFPVTTYSRNRSVDSNQDRSSFITTYKESSSKHHNKRSHIDDLEKTDNLNDFIDDCSNIHQDSSNSVKQKSILRYKPSEQK
ncbi:8886_t:CDS:2, partial [Funneliformis caledonium]